jgi:hypothetical protein
MGFTWQFYQAILPGKSKKYKAILSEKSKKGKAIEVEISIKYKVSPNGER